MEGINFPALGFVRSFFHWYLLFVQTECEEQIADLGRERD